MKSKVTKSLLVFCAVSFLGAGIATQFDAETVSSTAAVNNTKYLPGTCGNGVIKFTPTTRHELDLYMQLVEGTDGSNANLNCIDTQYITDMSNLFEGTNFNGDISEWNTSSVIDMTGMFKNSQFDGDISKWNVTSVISMESMFEGSQFSQYINDWDVSNVENMAKMFSNSKFNTPLSNWNFSSVDTSLGFLGFDESSNYGNENAGTLLVALDNSVDTCSNEGRSNYFYAVRPIDGGEEALASLNEKGCDIQADYLDYAVIVAQEPVITLKVGEAYDVFKNVFAISTIDGTLTPVLVDSSGFKGDGTDEPGVYDIAFKVTDSIGLSDAVIYKIVVEA